jgi:hypothetical protein
MKFVVMDVETANADMASICYIGAATYENSALVAEWYSLINPGNHFGPVNVAIHGIDEAAVLGAPTFGEASPMLAAILQDAVVVTHTHFDRLAIHQAATRWHASGLPMDGLGAGRPADLEGLRSESLRPPGLVQADWLHVPAPQRTGGREGRWADHAGRDAGQWPRPRCDCREGHPTDRRCQRRQD